MFFTIKWLCVISFFSVNTISNTLAEYAQFKKKMGLCQFHISCIIIYYESIVLLTDMNKRQEKSRRKYENTHYRYSIKMSSHGYDKSSSTSTFLKKKKSANPERC